MKRRNTRYITVCALMIALSCVSLCFGSLLPTGQLGFAALAALFGVAAVVETGLKGGAAVYICSLVLSLLISSAKAPSVLYGLFFGYYPLMKSFAEHRKSRVVEWVIKMVVLNAALTVIVLLFRGLVFDIQSLTDSLAVIYIAANIVFVVFDLGVTKVVGFYISNVQKRRGAN